MKRACVNLTTSRVTSRLMGIRLLYRMMNVSRLYAKLVEISPAQTHNIHLFSFTLDVRINPNCHYCKELQFQLVKCGISVCVFSPARERYQQASSVCSLFQMAAPTELTRAMTSRMPNKTRICMLVTRSTLERFSGALVEFWGGGQVNEYIETVLDEGESFTELQWFLLGEKKSTCSTLMRFEHFSHISHSFMNSDKTLGLPASVWSHGQCRQQFPQPTVCSWAGRHAVTPDLDPEELDWGQQERYQATNHDE